MGSRPARWWTLKYAYAIEPEQISAATRVNRPSATRAPPTSWMSAAHQPGQAPAGTVPPWVPIAPPRTPNREAAP